MYSRASNVSFTYVASQEWNRVVFFLDIMQIHAIYLIYNLVVLLTVVFPALSGYQSSNFLHAQYMGHPRPHQVEYTDDIRLVTLMFTSPLVSPISK
jgi:hypothetical protein